jgi:hypothetical protein
MGSASLSYVFLRSWRLLSYSGVMYSLDDLHRFIQALASIGKQCKWGPGPAFSKPCPRPHFLGQAMPLAVKNGKTLIPAGRAFSHFPLDGATSPYPFD